MEMKQMKIAATFLIAAAGLGATIASAQRTASPAHNVTFDHPAAAGSWGGIVRSGPGMEYARLVTLREGEPVTLVLNTHIDKDGYPWFLIRFRNGQLGFQWGGILCRTSVAVDGVYETCHRQAGPVGRSG
jgi:hypothetical protein